jgi:separase
MPLDADVCTGFKTRLEFLLSKALNAGFGGKSRPIEIDISLSDALLRLGREPEDNDVEDFLHFLLESFQVVGNSIDLGEIDLDLVSRCVMKLRRPLLLTYFHSQLTIELKDIIASLFEDQSMDDEHGPEHLILVLDRSTQSLPWESLPSLRGMDISRVPSLAFLRDRVMLHEEWSGHPRGSDGQPAYVVNSARSAYVLNPGGDLVKTQQRFQDTFATQGWRGFVDKVPTDSDMCEMLSSSDVFL